MISLRIATPARLVLLGCLAGIVGLAAGCNQDANNTGANGAPPAGPKKNADGTLNLAQHRRTIMLIMNESLALMPLLSQGGITAAPTATEEQKEKLTKVANVFALGDVKEPVIAYDIWMDELAPDQAKELAQKLDAFQVWIADMQACYPFAAGSQLTAVQGHVQKLDEHLKAIQADLKQ